jgi:hypothetical protein
MRYFSTSLKALDTVVLWTPNKYAVCCNGKLNLSLMKTTSNSWNGDPCSGKVPSQDQSPSSHRQVCLHKHINVYISHLNLKINKHDVDRGLVNYESTGSITWRPQCSPHTNIAAYFKFFCVWDRLSSSSSNPFHYITTITSTVVHSVTHILPEWKCAEQTPSGTWQSTPFSFFLWHPKPSLSPWFVLTFGIRWKVISLFNLSPFPLWDELLHPTTEQCEPGAMSVRSFAIATSSFAIAILPIWRLTHDTMRDDAHRT